MTSVKSVTGNLRKQPALRDVVARPGAEQRQGFLLLSFRRRTIPAKAALICRHSLCWCWLSLLSGKPHTSAHSGRHGRLCASVTTYRDELYAQLFCLCLGCLLCCQQTEFFHPLFVVLVNSLVELQDGVLQTAVALESVFGHDLRVLGVDEALLF